MNRPRASFPLGLSAALALALAPALACALQSDREQPVNIEAEYVDAVLEADSRSVLRGNVRISQGTLLIQAEQADLTRRGGALSQAVLTGAPATVEQQLDSGGLMRARAGRIDYDMVAEVLLLTGDVVVTQPEGELRGERIRYDLKSGRLEGGGDSGRVRMQFEPRATTQPTD